MRVDFSAVQNHQEQAVYDAVLAAASAHPGLAADAGLLGDVACVALNRLPPQYIRHAVDLSFYQSEGERIAGQQAVQTAVAQAFAYVQARTALSARR